MNLKELKKHVGKAVTMNNTKGGDLSLTLATSPSCFPFRCNKTNNVTPSSAIVASVSNVGGSGGYHNVVVSYSKERGYDFFCGDAYLEGGKKISENVDEILTGFEAALVDSGLGADETRKSLKDATDNFNSRKPSTGCHFWSSWNKSQTFCKHVAKALVHFNDNDSFKDVTAHYEQAYTNSKPPVEVKYEGDALTGFLDHYAFSKHCIIEGDKGSGKTFSCSSFLDKFNTIHFAGNSSVEAVDLKGFLVRYADKGGQERTIWQDGPLSSAFRQAANGTPTALFIDEFGRILEAERDILISALTPDHKGFYTLNTGRVVNCKDGVAEMETLRVTEDMFWLVGTTNVGTNYNVTDFESALLDRFRIHRLDTDFERMSGILKLVCKTRKFKVRVAKSLLSLYKGLEKFKTQGAISYEPNMRHMIEIAKLASCEDGIADEAIRTIGMWVGREMENGKLIQDEVDAVTMLIESSLSSWF